MKPKKTKKLLLNRKTISNLDNFEQLNVKGGYISHTCPERCTTSADPYCTNQCPTEDVICTNTEGCYTTTVYPCGTI
jgi:hypothetical protein